MKGLSPEPLPRTELAVAPDGAVRPDVRHRERAVRLRPGRARYFPKSRFLMLMRNDRLAELRTAFDEASHTLTIRSENREAAQGDLRTPEGRAAIERSSPSSAPTNCAGRRRCCTPRATASPTWRGRSCRSSISPRSRRWRTRPARRSHPLRFRGNLYVEGWPAWHEFDLLEPEIAIGPRRG